jgi:chromosome segregation ATPase
VALNDVSTDSAKLLTEKLALTRELSNLKPELEHLRSQTETHQSLLSEKLSLQRQLSTAQVAGDGKRATQRFLAKEEKTTEKDGRLEHQLEELRKELAREARQTESRARCAEGICKLGRRKAVLEGKLDAFRNKLRTTKEQLKQTEAELQKAQISTTTLTSRAILRKLRKSVRNPRKRSATHLDMDATIGTPESYHQQNMANEAQLSRVTNLPSQSHHSLIVLLAWLQTLLVRQRLLNMQASTTKKCHRQ